MVDGQTYEILADTEFSNDTILFTRKGNVVHSIISGGEFKEPHKHWYDLSIINKIEGFKEVEVAEMTLDELEWLDAEVYIRITGLVAIPQEYSQIAGIDK